MSELHIREKYQEKKYHPLNLPYMKYRNFTFFFIMGTAVKKSSEIEKCAQALFIRDFCS